MNRRVVRRCSALAAIATLMVLIAACSSSGGKDAATSQPPPASPDGGAPVAQMVGASGGTVVTPDGVVLDIPEGALDSDVVVTVASTSVTAPIAGAVAAGPAFVFGPAGLFFKKNVRLTLPLDASKIDPAVSSAVSVATAPDGSAAFLLQDALRLDESRLVTAIRHFSVYMPVVHSLDCTSAPGEAELTQCTFGCPSGYHSTEIRWANPPECGLVAGALGVISTCERNDGFQYSTCGTLGCDPGYHVAAVKDLSLGLCETGTVCEVNAGAELDSCDWTCPAGYERTGSALALSPCGMLGAVSLPSSHCKATTSPPPNACSRLVNLSADHQYGETCVDGHSYIIDCACDTSLCRCYEDSSLKKKDVLLSCKDLATQGHDALETLCGGPKVASCPSALPCSSASASTAADAGAGSDAGGMSAGGDAGSASSCPPFPDFASSSASDAGTAEAGVDAGGGDAGGADGG